MVEEQTTSAPQPPPPLPTGWVLKESRSQPDTYYYYHPETGVSTWDEPQQLKSDTAASPERSITTTTTATTSEIGETLSLAATTAATLDSLKESLSAASAAADRKESSSSAPKRHAPDDDDDDHDDDDDVEQQATKKGKTLSSSSSATTANKPSQVRILHILKKHNNVRRPTSWRQTTITIPKEQAIEELQGLLEILQESASEGLDDLRATFEELARTESDCSSAKRGGDLGFFGPGKMQAAFEEAAFDLPLGQLSGLVETKSGVHVLLRIG